MGTVADNVQVGQKLPLFSRTPTQKHMDLFEATEIVDHPNIHSDPAASQAAGIGASPIASGRMVTAYVCETMHRVFGDDWLHSGVTDLVFIRPVRGGDTITIHATVKEKIADGKKARVACDVYAENQNGDKTAVGTASVVTSQ